MSDSKNRMATYLKDEECMKTDVNPFSVPWTRKRFPIIMNGVCPGLCTLFFKTSTSYLKFMLYYAVIWIVLGYQNKGLFFVLYNLHV